MSACFSKIRAVALIVAFLGTFALAEESGVFLGANFGYAGFKQETIGSFDINGTPIATSTTTIKADSFSAGVFVGYKYFFNPYVGMRIYAGYDVFTPEFEFEGEREEAVLLNFGANLDFLVNFISTQKADFGFFVGAGVGGNWWISKDITQLKRDIRDNGLGFKVRDLSLDVAVNAGLRVNFARRHSIEIGARVPFLPTILLNESIENGVAGNTAKITMKIQNRQIYGVVTRYAFMF